MAGFAKEGRGTTKHNKPVPIMLDSLTDAVHNRSLAEEVSVDVAAQTAKEIHFPGHTGTFKHIRDSQISRSAFCAFLRVTHMYA